MKKLSYTFSHKVIYVNYIINIYFKLIDYTIKTIKSPASLI